MKKYSRLRIRTHLRAGKYCQTIRTDNEGEKVKLEQKGYHCLKTAADMGGLVERWQCCLNE